MESETAQGTQRAGLPAVAWGGIGLGIFGTLMAANSVIQGVIVGNGMVVAATGLVVAVAVAALAIWLYRSVLLGRIARMTASTVAARRAVPDVLLGVAGGVLFMVVSCAIVGALGGVHISWQPTPGFNATVLLGVLAMVILSSVVEEIVFRGVILEAVRQWVGPRTGVIVSSVVFGAMHLLNPGATVWSAVAIAMEAGVLFGILYLVTGSLWVTIGIHAGWNLTEALLGIPVSGEHPQGLLTVTPTGSPWISGGAFGIEASVVPVVIGGIVALVAAVVFRRRKDQTRV